MTGRKDLISSEDLTKIVVKGMHEKKAVDIIILNMKAINNAVADYFVICSGSSATQIDAISDSVDVEVSKNAQINPWHREGIENKEWILLDYVDVVVHIFKQECREFYGLEDLWGDAETTTVNAEAIA